MRRVKLIVGVGLVFAAALYLGHVIIVAASGAQSPRTLTATLIEGGILLGFLWWAYRLES